MKAFIAPVVALGVLLSGQPTLAAPLEVGGTVPKISAQDQHGAAYRFTNGTAFLLVALDMDSAKAANQKLAGQGAGYLEKQGAAYLMDIHTMPDIGRFFALRKMRKYPQRIILVETAGTLNWVAAKPGQVTVLALTPAGLIKKIAFWKPASEPVAGLFK